MSKWVAIFAWLMLTACGTYEPTVRDNFAYLYGRNSEQLRIPARIYHSSATTSIIYFKLYTTDLLYRSTGDGEPFKALVKVHYDAYDALGSKLVLDSASTFVRDQTGDPLQEKELVGTMTLDLNPGKDFVIKVTAKDLHRDTESAVIIPVDRSTPGNRQYFLPLDTATGIPFFDDHLDLPRSNSIRCDTYAGQVLIGNYFERPNELPGPVFSTRSSSGLDLRPDLTFQVRVSSTGLFDCNAQESGIYHFVADSTSSVGYSLMVFGEGYPEVRMVDDMIEPMRYITSEKEFNDIVNAPEKRAAIEQFWIDAAGNKDRGRQVIRAYYGRVESANRHFTSHAPGWRTDRGLVHIIFGTPNVIHKNERSETWIYGEETSLMSLAFTFVQNDGPFSDNDMRLDRDPSLKGAWYRNVESWRNGRIYQH